MKESHIDQFARNPEKMFWSCSSYRSVVPLQPVDGMMRLHQYVDVLQRRVVLEVAMGFPGGFVISQQDLAPCHTSKMVTQLFQQKGIHILDRPGYPQDMNPMRICDPFSRGNRKERTVPHNRSLLRP